MSQLIHLVKSDLVNSEKRQKNKKGNEKRQKNEFGKRNYVIDRKGSWYFSMPTMYQSYKSFKNIHSSKTLMHSIF